MATDVQPRSFSAGRRWGIFFSVVISIVAFTAVVLMLNYLGARYFLRFSWGADDRQKLSPLTISLLQSITNDVKIIVYYDRGEPLCDEITDLIKEYQIRNPRITFETVDYKVDPESAQKIKATYNLGGTDKKNLIIVASGDKTEVVSGDQLATTKLEQLPDEPQTNGSGASSKPNFVRHLSSFQGESVLDGCLLTVTSKKPFLACITVGHSEASLGDTSAVGYREFYSVLKNCNVDPREISLAGTNEIPSWCALLIIPGPIAPAFGPEEIRKVGAFLASGGRLLVLFNYSRTRTGLESLLFDWGVAVGDNVVTDSENMVTEQSPSKLGSIMVDQFNSQHDLVNPLAGSRLYMYQPRSIVARQMTGNNAPSAKELAWTGPLGRMTGGAGTPVLPGHIPVMVAVEKLVGVGAAEKTAARIVVTGDSLFLDNETITRGDNRNEDFARLAVNWLLNSTPALQNVGPRRMLEYKLSMTNREMVTIRWIFLAGMPGSILLFGGLVWLRRRQ